MKCLTTQIIEEWRQREASARARSVSAEAVVANLSSRAKCQERIADLIFFTSPGEFGARLSLLQQAIKSGFRAASPGLQPLWLHFLADLTLSLRSFLPMWNLQNQAFHGEAVLTDIELKVEADRVQALASELAAQAPAAAEQALRAWRAETTGRLKAEQVPDPEREAAVLVGSSVDEYLTRFGQELAHSHLRRLSEMRAAGQTATEVSNDYAAFLLHAMYLGASFATCNPPLVDMAWVADPGHWNPIVDNIIAENREADGDTLARLVTLEVVLANMRLLRPVFLLTEGRMGCVCLQVNPHMHDNAPAMVADALFIHGVMRKRLSGGVPNVVFKLPGTWAGLEACRALTGQGIGTTITVNFGMFQHAPFARAIQEGQAIFGCIVEMNGRLAYPVRDELLAKLGDLAAYGIDEAGVREAAAWAGVAVVKRLYRLLIEKGYDIHRVKPLIASLRIYTGGGYENLPSAFPDITEVIGAGIISVFPNVRRPFDREPCIKLEAQHIHEPVPDHILDVLRHSELFKQAYYVADQDWLFEDDDNFRPHHELRLEDETGTAAWTPVYNTLTEFCNSYDVFVDRILERKEMASRGWPK
jgi:transaldolase